MDRFKRGYQILFDIEFYLLVLIYRKKLCKKVCFIILPNGETQMHIKEIIEQKIAIESSQRD